jgi:hypothetical protein
LHTYGSLISKLCLVGGKHLLSLGKFSPFYYAFYDQDIIYDSEYVGSSEVQNDIEPRIQENTPRLKTQYIFHGAETELDNSYVPINTKNKLLFYDHIGTSKYEGDNIPTWDIKVLNNTISSSVPYFTSSFNKIINLPQINLNLDYDLYYVKKQNIDINQLSVNAFSSEVSDELPLESLTPDDYRGIVESYFPNNTTLVFGEYEDESYVAVEQKNFVIDIIENNNLDEKDSFEIEVFEYTDDSEDNIKQLYFFQNYFTKNVQNDILIDSRELLSKIPNIDITPDYVEYYFNIIADNYISNEVVCKYIDNGIYNPKTKTKYKNVIKCKQTANGVSPSSPVIPQTKENCDV